MNSFRAYNPDTPLCLIPFDEECAETFRLAQRYNFSIFDDGSFAKLEAIGRKLELGHASYGPNWFRRYASFWGPFERFLYLDARQIILANLMPFVEATAEFDLDLVYYDTALDQVYEPGPLRQAFLRKGKARGFNSGRWASRRGLFSLSDFRDLVDAQVAVRDQLNPRNTDQAFINFCCDTKNLRMAKISDLLGETVSSGWARQPGKPYQDEVGVWRMWDHGGLEHKKKLLLMHWAGFGASDPLPNAKVLRDFGGKFPVRTGQVMRKFLASHRASRRLFRRTI